MEEALLDKMNKFISDAAVSSVPDEDNLPFEPLDAFSTDPAEFGEMAEYMLDKVENIFDLTRIYNRHSSKYLKAFALLERGIRQLGSVCVTKTALGEHDTVWPELGQLTTRKLYGMASFNYRKLNAALKEKLGQSNDLYPELTDAFFRCFTLLRRLRATERKIHTYYSDKYFREEDYKPSIEGFAFSKKSWTKCYTEKKEEAPAFRDAPAYPVIKNSEFRIQKSEGKDQGPRIEDQGAGVSGAEIQNSEIRIQKSENRDPEVKDSGTGKRIAPNAGSEKTELPEAEAEPAAVGPQAGQKEPKALPKPAEDDPGTGKKTERAEAAVNETNTGSGPEMKNQRPDLPFGVGGPTPGGNSFSSHSPLHRSVGGPTPGGDTPPCVEIMQRAMMRGPATEKGGIAFTTREIQTLADDPLLDTIYPELALWVEQAVHKLRT